MNFKRQRRLGAKIDLTPMIDIIFNITLFLMVSTTMIGQPSIKVALPRAATAEVEKLKDLTVTLTKDGHVYLNAQLTTLPELKSALANLVDRNAPDSLLVVRADVDVRHGDVVKVMDDAKQLGVKRLALATEAEVDK